MTEILVYSTKQDSDEVALEPNYIHFLSLMGAVIPNFEVLTHEDTYAYSLKQYNYDQSKNFDENYTIFMHRLGTTLDHWDQARPGLAKSPGDLVRLLKLELDEYQEAMSFYINNPNDDTQKALLEEASDIIIFSSGILRNPESDEAQKYWANYLAKTYINEILEFNSNPYVICGQKVQINSRHYNAALYQNGTSEFATAWSKGMRTDFPKRQFPELSYKDFQPLVLIESDKVLLNL